MATNIVNNLGAAIGCRLLPKRQQLAFVEYAKGAVSVIDLVRPSNTTVSQGSTVIKGTWIFDCETGGLGGALSGPGDIWWEQIDTVRRQMRPVGGASIINLGRVNYATLTPTVLQNLAYARAPIPGNNDSTNQLADGDVFAVATNAGNVAKVRVTHYDYNMAVEWATYGLASPYHCLGTGYTTPEDIAVCADERTAYVTERTGNLLKLDLQNASRAAATIVTSGMQEPHQIALDEAHQQAYVVEFANPGRLLRVDLKTGQKTVLLNGLQHAIGLLISPDLAYAYISEQGAGRVSRYDLQGGGRLDLAAMTNPFFLTWANPDRSAFFVTERDPVNRVSLVQTLPHAGSARQVAANLGFRPSSVACLDAMRLLVCCDTEITRVDLLEGSPITGGIFKGIGLVPASLLDANGLTNTQLESTYPYQFPKGSPFGGRLTLQVNHTLARQSGVTHYRVLVDNVPFLANWSDLKLNPATGVYDTLVQFKPEEINGQPGYYPVRPADQWFYNVDLGMLLDSTRLLNGRRTFTVELVKKNAVSGPLPQPPTVINAITLAVYIDNQTCKATIDMPAVGGVMTPMVCGMLPYKDAAQHLTTHYLAAHPQQFATYAWRLGRAGQGALLAVPGCCVDGQASTIPVTFDAELGKLLGTCASAAFYAQLHVYAKAINGYGRQSQYDAASTIAFAITLRP